MRIQSRLQLLSLLFACLLVLTSCQLGGESDAELATAVAQAIRATEAVEAEIQTRVAATMSATERSDIAQPTDTPTEPTELPPDSNRVTATVPTAAGLEFVQEGLPALYIAPESITADPNMKGTPTAQVQIYEGEPQTAAESQILVGQAYDIELKNARLNGLALLALHYQRDALPQGVEEDSLAVGYYAEDLRQWVTLPSQVDTDAQTVSAAIGHLSTFAILGWFSDNHPPIILDLHFSPVTYYVDCSKIEDGQWLREHPESLALTVDDPDGLLDIKGLPEVTLRADYVFAQDKSTDPIQMPEANPGKYQLDWNLLPGQQSIRPLSEALFSSCGNLRTYTATVRVRDHAGHVTEQSAVQDVRYEPIPEIALISPIMDGPASATATLIWSLTGSQQILQQYEKVTLVVGSDASLERARISADLPLTQQSYTIPDLQALDSGKRYYWQVTAYKPSQPIGSSWRFVRSQMASFIVDAPAGACEPSTDKGCIRVRVTKSNGTPAKGADVSLYDNESNDYEHESRETNAAGYAVFPAEPGHLYFAWVAALSGHRAWAGGSCPVEAIANQTVDYPVRLRRSPGGTYACGDEEGTAVPPATDTPRPKPTPTKTPKPTFTSTPLPTATKTPNPTATETPRPTATSTPLPAPTAVPPTLLLEDGFDGTSLNTSLWGFGTNSSGGACTVSDGMLTLLGGQTSGGGAWVMSNEAFSTDGRTLVLEMRVSISKADWGNWGFYGSRSAFSFYPLDGQLGVAIEYQNPSYTPLPWIDSTQEHEYRIEYGQQEARFYVDGELVHTATENLTREPLQIRLDRPAGVGGQRLWIDYVRLSYIDR